jgi:uncharacterized protein
MLRIDLGALRHGPIDMVQEVPTGDPAFQHLEFELGEPVHVSGRLMEAGSGSYYWHGELRTSVKGACRRCLADVNVRIVQPVNVLFTEEPDADDPAAYVIPARATEIDAGEAVREELMLAVPAYVLCSEECRGICPRCGADLNAGACGCEPEGDPRWSALDKLKAVSSEEEGE